MIQPRLIQYKCIWDMIWNSLPETISRSIWRYQLCIERESFCFWSAFDRNQYLIVSSNWSKYSNYKRTMFLSYDDPFIIEYVLISDLTFPGHWFPYSYRVSNIFTRKQFFILKQFSTWIRSWVFIVFVISIRHILYL